MFLLEVEMCPTMMTVLLHYNLPASSSAVC